MLTSKTAKNGPAFLSWPDALGPPFLALKLGAQSTPASMSLFKRSNKIESSSATSTPVQVPGPSKKEQPSSTQATKITPEEAALETLMQKSMGNPTTGHYIH
ncbi:hypothetical protein BGZ70_010504 [Mortierella alpina]|uniref:Uncharacterized protein n=1 Tax=Mortierella alpina TaxID=64518 RepID=A0A9P6IZ15_MORAP|nr:hypothetical protein BGZ70_010504 [Mortierella alpina]